MHGRKIVLMGSLGDRRDFADMLKAYRARSNVVPCCVADIKAIERRVSLAVSFDATRGQGEGQKCCNRKSSDLLVICSCTSIFIRILRTRFAIILSMIFGTGIHNPDGDTLVSISDFEAGST